MFISRRRLVIGSVMALLVLSIVGVLVYVQWLDPGHKHDTTSDLVTPTLAAKNARIYEVAAGESKVDFVTQVRGVDLNGVFPVESGTITLEPVGDQLRVLVRLNIDVDGVSTGNAAVDGVLRSRAAMATGDYPIAFYVATSRDLVPVTEEEITFWLDGTLEVHGVAHVHAMFIRAQEVGHDMWAIATSDLDLANHGVNFPAIFGSTVIQLTAHLQAYEALNLAATASPPAQ